MKLSHLALATLLACGGLSTRGWAAKSGEPVSPIQPAKLTNPKLVELGKKLYFDPRLSKSGFISCNSCHNLSMGGTDNLHNGPAFGGTSFQKMGVVEAYKATSPAEGRSAVTGKDADRLNFKVPTLRNVELTYPYFHDGEATTLEQAVDTMGRLQLGKQFTIYENASIVAFLKTLTGDQPAFKLPQLPPSTNTTPRPKPFE